MTKCTSVLTKVFLGADERLLPTWILLLYFPDWTYANIKVQDMFRFFPSPMYFFPLFRELCCLCCFLFLTFFSSILLLTYRPVEKKDARWINVLLLNKSECLHWQYLHFTLTNSVKHKKRKVAKLFKKVLDVFFLWPFQRRI